MLQHVKYIIYRENEYYVAQCLNVDVSSFGKTIDEAVKNIKEAVELYLQDDEGLSNYHMINEALLGEAELNV